MGIKLGAPNLMEHARLVRSWLWRWEDNTTFAPGAMTSDPILGEDIRGALFWDQGGTGEADALMAARKNAADALEYAEFAIKGGAYQDVAINAADFTHVGTLTPDNADSAVALLNTQIIQAALDYVRDNEGAGEVYVPGDLFWIHNANPGVGTAALLIPNNVGIRGAGRDKTTLKLAADGDGHMLTFQITPGISAEIQGEGQFVTDLALDGNRDEQDQDINGAGIRVGNNNRVRIERVYITDTVGYGLGLQGDKLRFPTVRDIEINHTKREAFDCKGVYGGTFENIYVHDSGTAHAVDIRGEMTTINNIWAIDNDNDGINIRLAGLNSTPREIRWMNASNLYAFGNGGNGIFTDAVATELVGETGRHNIVNAFSVRNGASGFRTSGDVEDVYTKITNGYAEENVDGFELDASGHVTLVNCSSRANTADGFEQFETDGRNDVFLGCDAHANGAIGFRIASSSADLIGCRAENNTTRDMEVVQDGCKIMGGRYGQVRVAATSFRTLFQGVDFANASGTALTVQASAEDTRIESCDFTNVTGTKVNDAGTRTVFRDNLAYVTSSKGVTSVADGGTIAHGLVAAPTKYGATTTTADEYLAITAASSTTLTVALTKHDGTAGTTANVAWWAEV